MQLYVMRHGQASARATSDAKRALTEQGHLEAKLMAKWLNDNNIVFDQVFVSPFERAQQTASTLMSAVSHSAPITTIDIITPSGDAREVHDYIDGVCQADKLESVLIISHMPLVSYLVDELTFDTVAPLFSTAAIAEISYDKQKMKGDLTRHVAPYDLC
ncbi:MULTISPECIES: phosphohistidine phosphatase SixA [Thalassotalea]|uniref:phosphohistidine phosphatase SixA n=1 Tax=Thalassotalea TaxID=1518149 RepID=UPI000944F9FC|nr:MULTISPECIES: phosphohistidine phosphatase SixA [Thalassotalea]OKY24615.1 phosphohistidine phosphatase SixA [Thalassotalea sp. PP2-459]